jgi:predicted signal transduction protein with EAL and GGDEF domain
MKVIGEGVETAEQLACLQELGCNSGQGFVFASPLSPDELVAFVERNRASARKQTSRSWPSPEHDSNRDGGPGTAYRSSL